MRSLADGAGNEQPAAAGEPVDVRCAASFREEARRIFVDVVQRALIARGPPVAPRPVFRKAHGAARGRLLLSPDMPDRFRHGWLAERELAVWARFSSDTAPDRPDSENATLGIGLKLFGIERTTLDEDDPDSGTCDLLLQNHDRFFVDDGPSFCAFSQAAVSGTLPQYLAAHPETQAVLEEMAKAETSLLRATYWSVLPYACGSEAMIKYRLEPLDSEGALEPAGGDSDANYLKSDLQGRLARQPAVFTLAVQAFVNDQRTPLDRASHRWETPFEPVGTLVLDRQELRTPGQDAYGENLSIHPWRTPWANRPLGSIAESRRVAYPAAARLRRWHNGVPLAEPRRPR